MFMVTSEYKNPDSMDGTRYKKKNRATACGALIQPQLLGLLFGNVYS